MIYAESLKIYLPKNLFNMHSNKKLYGQVKRYNNSIIFYVIGTENNSEYDLIGIVTSAEINIKHEQSSKWQTNFIHMTWTAK